jgi:endonuclease/exonuclease/phosphatase (EEP) superfamily protein YafD
MFVALCAATLVIVLLTVLPVWGHPHWVIRSLDFPRLQLAVLAAILLIAQLIFLDTQRATTWMLLLPTLLCIAWQLWWIAPYTRVWPCEVHAAKPGGIPQGSSAKRISIMSANVLTPNRNVQALLDLVNQRKPDMLVTLETDQWWQDKLDCLLSEMPYALQCPLDNLYGMHVYSRLALETSEIKYLVEKDVPSMHMVVRMRTGECVRVHVLHPAPPSPTQNTESTERDAELLLVARSIEGNDQPVIVTGDLNDVAWSVTTRLFRKLSGLLDPRVGRGMFNTFHVDYPFLRWPLDHIFHSKHFTLISIERLPTIGSDHFPLLTELLFAPEQAVAQQGLQAEADDAALAQSKIEDQSHS